MRLAVLLVAVAGLMTACDEAAPAAPSGYGSRLGQDSFDIGTADHYRTPGVYTQFNRSQGVYLVSGHGMLVALAAECTNDAHSQAAVIYDDIAGIYRCSTCGARYTRDGLNIGSSQTKISLRRCRIRASGHIYDPQTTLLVDPVKRFTQEKQEWSKHTSFFPLEVAERDRDTRRQIEHINAAAQELPPLAR